MQILYITYDGITEPVGSSQVTSYLKRLSGKDIRFYLLSFEKKRYFDDEAEKERLRSELEGYGIDWRPLRYHKRVRALATLLDITVGIFSSLGIARKARVDIVHARSYIAALMAWIVSGMIKAGFVFDMRGFWPDERVDAGSIKKDSFLYRMIKKMESLFVRRADRIIVLTNKAKEDLVSAYRGLDKDKISVIPCCADTELFRFDPAAFNAVRSEYNINGRFVFIHTGSLIGWYMLKEMLEFFKVIKEIEPSAVFMLVTADADKGMFFRMSDSMGISRDDVILAESRFEDVRRYISVADTGLFFIKPTFSKRASCPIKFAEYLSCGLPVICNKDVGDLDNIIAGNRVGVLIDAFSKGSYSEAYRKISELLRDKDLKNRCRKVAEELFSLEKGADSYLKIYKALVESRE